MNKLLSIAIPAYNNPELLSRAIDSILKQTYRPIEIVINDDASPNTLEDLIIHFKKQNISNVSFNFKRNEKNLGFYLNNLDVFRRCSGDFLIFFHHDDFIIDNSFFEDSINQLKKENINIAISNSFVENNLQLMMTWNFDKWIEINGNLFLNNYLYSIAHPSISSIVMNIKLLKKLNYENLYLSTKEINFLGYEIDEAFLMVILLSLESNVSVSGKIYSCRGNPAFSYSKSEIWKSNGGAYSGFIPLYNYYLSLTDQNKRYIIKNILMKVYVNFENFDFKVILFFKKKYGVFWETFFIILVGFILNKIKIITNFKTTIKKILMN